MVFRTQNYFPRNGLFDFVSISTSGVGIVENLAGTQYPSVPKNFFLAGTRYPAVPKFSKFRWVPAGTLVPMGTGVPLAPTPDLHTRPCKMKMKLEESNFKNYFSITRIPEYLNPFLN